MTNSRDAILGLLLRYARHTDAGDDDEVGRMFAHGPFQSTRGPARGGVELAEHRKRNIVTYDGAWRTKHVTTNVMIDVDEGADAARARSYFTLLQQPPGRPLVVLGCGRYYDRFEHVDGRWRFAHRLSMLDAWGDLSAHIRGWQPPELPYAVQPGGPPADELSPMPLPDDAHAAIETLIFTYAERHDLGDADGVGRLFAHGRRRYDHDGRALGGEELAAVLRRHIQHHDGSPRTKHVTTNVLVEVDDDAASASSSFTVLQATRALPLQVIAAGRYHDRFERVDGTWRFAERVIFLDLQGDFSQHAVDPGPGAAS